MMLNKVDLCALVWAQPINPFSGFPPGCDYDISVRNVKIFNWPPPIKYMMI